jgi:hypothetical protein
MVIRPSFKHRVRRWWNDFIGMIQWKWFCTDGIGTARRDLQFWNSQHCSAKSIGTA